MAFQKVQKRHSCRITSDMGISVGKSAITIGKKVKEFLDKDYAEAYFDLDHSLLGLIPTENKRTGWKVRLNSSGRDIKHDRNWKSWIINCSTVVKQIVPEVYDDGKIEGNMFIIEIKLNEPEKIKRDLDQNETN